MSVLIMHESFDSCMTPGFHPTWYIGDQPVCILLTIEEGNPLVYDHDGEQVSGVATPLDTGSVLHLSSQHGVAWARGEPRPSDCGQLPGHGGQLGGNHLDPVCRVH